MNTNAIAPVGLGQEWMDRLAADAKEQASAEKAASNFFSTKGGILSWNNMPLPNNRMDAIALASVHENVYYAGAKFDAQNPASPVCYAYSVTGEGMAPHPDVEQVQSLVGCAKCPQMKWGSGDRQQGTACRPIRRVAFVPASAAGSPDAALKAVVGLMRVPITSVKNWARYVNQIAVTNLPTYAIICDVAVVPDAKTMFQIAFTPKGAVSDPAVLAVLAERATIERDAMQIPYTKRLNPNQALVAPIAAPLQGVVQQATQPAPAFGAPPPPTKY